MGILYGQTDSSFGSVHSRDYESESGRFIQRLDRLKQLETIKVSFQSNRDKTWTDGSRFIRRQAECTKNKIRELETRPLCVSNRLILNELGKGERLRLSPVLPHRQSLKEVSAEKANLILITSTWPTQTWYPMLLGLITDYQFLLPPLRNLLTSPTGEIHPLTTQNALTMAAWKVSGDELLNEEFLSKLPTFSQRNGEKVQKLLTNMPEVSGAAGLVNERLIPFRPLWSMW